jgi:hypothetical protein
MTRETVKTHMKKTTTTLALLLVPVLAATPLDAAAQADDFSWRGRLSADQTLEVRGVMGSIRAELASGDAIEVRAAKRGGRRSDATDVNIEVVPHAGGVTICAVYPTPRGTRRENRCGPDGSYSMNTSNNDVRVDFVVRVPAGVQLMASNVSGNVDVTGLRSYVDARTVSGNVQVATTEAAQARTVSGNVTASLGSLAGTGSLEFKTVSGNISVRLPATAGAYVSIKTVSGGFRSDFPVTVEGRMSPRQLEGTIGNGGRRVTMETVSGNVRLLRDD